MKSVAEGTEEKEFHYYFFDKPVGEVSKTAEIWPKTDQEKKAEIEAHLLTNVVKGITTELEVSGVKNYEVSLEGFIEISAGFSFLGGKTGFKATLKFIGGQSKPVLE